MRIIKSINIIYSVYVYQLLQIHKLNIKIGLFTIQELNNATKRINNGKACGLDEIPAEVWKLTEFQNILLNFCNKRIFSKSNKKMD